MKILKSACGLRVNYEKLCFQNNWTSSIRLEHNTIARLCTLRTHVKCPPTGVAPLPSKSSWFKRGEVARNCLAFFEEMELRNKGNLSLTQNVYKPDTVTGATDRFVCEPSSSLRYSGSHFIKCTWTIINLATWPTISRAELYALFFNRVRKLTKKLYKKKAKLTPPIVNYKYNDIVVPSFYRYPPPTLPHWELMGAHRLILFRGDRIGLRHFLGKLYIISVSF